MSKSKKYVEILDTTLRDGEQTPGVAFKPVEKLQIARVLLDRVKVDRLEVASARVSEGERKGAQSIVEWAKKKNMQERIEILGFVDKGKSVDWIKSIDGKVINLLTKGSEAHCRGQLRKTPEKHCSDVCECIDYALSQGIKVNVYLEDWSGGMMDNFSYIYAFMEKLAEYNVERVMLPDTLGLLNTENFTRYFDWMNSAFPDIRFDFHGHNDYGFGTANCLAAARAGVNGIHVTVNGLGERAGNPSLCEVVAAINDMSDRACRVQEKQLDYVAELVQTISGKRVASNAPIIGSDVFTQTCGVHADGDKKGNLYINPLTPERFSRKRIYALGKLSGKASIEKNLEVLGMELNDEDSDRVLKEVIRLGDKKKKVTPQELPFIIADVLHSEQDKVVEFTNYQVVTQKGALPQAEVELKYKGQLLSSKAKGDGGYDAFMKAVRKALKSVQVKAPKLLDYEVRIPPGGKSDALVETTITWDTGEVPPLVTVGIDSDQLEAAVVATGKMLNLTVK